jgi:hypothetical protein
MESIDIWRYLHDGSLERVDGTVPGYISLHISIPYLRKAFQPKGDGFVLKLANCTRFELVGDDGVAWKDLEEIATHSLEILSIESESPLALYTTFGTLNMAYRDLEIFLDTGEQITGSMLDKASADYWDAWSRQHGRGA